MARTPLTALAAGSILVGLTGTLFAQERGEGTPPSELAPRADETEAPAPPLTLGATRFELESGVRLGIDYHGLSWAPGIWHELPTGIAFGLFAPVDLAGDSEGRNGIDISIGIEPRVRFSAARDLDLEVAMARTFEEESDITGVWSYGAGVVYKDTLRLRVTREHYSSESGGGAEFLSAANFVDASFVGPTGAKVAAVEAALSFLLFAAVAGSD